MYCVMSSLFMQMKSRNRASRQSVALQPQPRARCHSVDVGSFSGSSSCPGENLPHPVERIARAKVCPGQVHLATCQQQLAVLREELAIHANENAKPRFATKRRSTATDPSTMPFRLTSGSLFSNMLQNKHTNSPCRPWACTQVEGSALSWRSQGCGC